MAEHWRLPRSKQTQKALDEGVSNPYKYNPVEYPCALCGEPIEIMYPSDTDLNHFCNRTHKREHHNNMRLSKAQVSALQEVARLGVAKLPRTSTLVKMADGKKRVMPLLEWLPESQAFMITDAGRKYLKFALDKKQESE